MKVRMKSQDESYRRATRNFLGNCKFLGIEAIRQTTSCTIYEEGHVLCFFSKILKLHFKIEFNPQMHKSRAIFFLKSGHFLSIFKKDRRELPLSPGSYAPELMFSSLKCPNSAKFTSDFKKDSPTQLVTALLV